MSVRALITGMSGFAAQHLATYAQSQGAFVYGMSRSAVSMPHLNVIRGDLSDPHAVQRAVGESEPDIVFHLAAQTPANAPAAAPEHWLSTNPVYTLNLLEAIRIQRPHARVLIVSSSAVYGHVPSDRLPIVEAEPIQPTTMYGVSKGAQELLAIRYASEHNLHIVRARPFNQLGPGEPQAMLTSALAAQVAAIAQGQAPPVVRMRHRATSRDYTDIRDAVRAYWLLLESGVPGAVYNVSSGIATPIGELVERLLRLAGIDAQIEESSPTLARGDIAAQSGSNAAVTEATGWRRRFGLDESLAELLRSFGVPIDRGSE
jgi:GDP-4-dehydro-6-deoxy-D-mannose reductase